MCIILYIYIIIYPYPAKDSSSKVLQGWPRGGGDTAIIFIKSRPIPGGKWVIRQEIQIGNAM